MLKNIYSKERQKVKHSIDALNRELNTLRSSKVSIHILDRINVNYYGTLTPLNQVATVLKQNASTINIKPWEKNILKDIQKGLQESNIGLTPAVEGDSVKLFFPPMTFEQRKENVKQAKSIAEKIKISIRNSRKDTNNKLKKMEKDKEITEDELRKALSNTQNIIDDAIKEIDKITQLKEKELLSV